MAFRFNAINSTRFTLTGTTLADIVDLRDSLINRDEVAPTLPQDVELNAGGIGFFRTITITGDAGNDVVLADDRTLPKLIVNAGLGNDTVHGGLNNDQLNGGAGHNFLDGHSGNDTIMAGAGNDTILGGAGADVIGAGDGLNQVTGGAGNDTINAGLGNDTILGDDGDAAATGGHDVINAGAGNNRVSGEAGDDAITTLQGNDSIDGGTGNDTVLAGAGADTVTGAAGNDRLFGQAGNDSISGGDGNDTVDGGEGADLLEGDAGNDFIIGGAGADTIVDGIGSDLVVLSDNENDQVNNTQDTLRDVFRWTSLGAADGTPETDTIAFFDTRGGFTNDQLDFSMLGPNLVAEIFGSVVDGGAFVVYASEAARALGQASLVVEWSTGAEDVFHNGANIGVQAGADIKVGFGWHVYDAVRGDTVF